MNRDNVAGDLLPQPIQTVDELKKPRNGSDTADLIRYLKSYFMPILPRPMINTLYVFKRTMARIKAIEDQIFQ